MTKEANEDWLIHPFEAAVEVVEDLENNEISLSNGLIRRTFRMAPNPATVGFDNLMTGESLLRGVKPEAIVVIDGKNYAVGGLKGQPNYAYLVPEWLEQLTSDPEAFQFVGYEVGPILKRFDWKKKRHSEDRPWPPPGRSLVLKFRHSDRISSRHRDRCPL